MTEKVWVSLMMATTALYKSMYSAMFDEDKEKALDAVRRHSRGEWLPADRFPQIIYSTKENRREKRLPDIFYGYGFWCVSADCAKVLSKFDLGKGGFYPVKLMQRDRVTPIEGNYLCLNFGAHKSAFLPRQSNQEVLSKPDTRFETVWLKAHAKDSDIAVAATHALAGSDLWMDQALRHAVFFSDRLVEALKAADMSRRFMFRKCRVVETQ